ncbi:hypothetical protein LCGC14_0527590 [marine sediment metagenome]|uniref:Uncharacterized protein n=1 Tax=marine sediment metagenome TaxID=412755 RepID=A0A0F9V4V1_9ZZZZ
MTVKLSTMFMLASVGVASKENKVMRRDYEES